mgnify:CR=1 FL=1
MKILIVDSISGEEIIRDLSIEEITQITQSELIDENIQENMQGNTQNNANIMNENVTYIVEWMRREKLADSAVIDSLIFLSSVQR